MQQNLPELPAARRARYVSLGLPAADAVVLADEPPTAAYFDAVLAAGAPAKPAANWVMGDIMAFCKARCLTRKHSTCPQTLGHARALIRCHLCAQLPRLMWDLVHVHCGQR